MDWGSRVTYLASTAFKDRVVPFGIKDSDRLKHLCVLGKIGSGRADLLARMALQDIERGIGTLVLDASGNLGPLIMERLDADALARLVHLDASEAEYPFSWDIVAEFRARPEGKTLFFDALASVYGVARDALVESLGEYVLEEAGRTVLDPFLLLTEEKIRDAAYPPESEEAKAFAALKEKHTETADAMSESGRYLMKDTMVRNLVGQKTGKFSLSSLSEGSVFIVDLSRIRVFPTRISPILKLFTYAMRARLGAGQFASLYLHDGLRYYRESDAESLVADQRIPLTLSDTVYRESDLPLREKILTRCGSVVTYEPHQADAPLVERLFYPYVTPEELSGLEAGESCALLTIDGVRTRPFFASALDLPERRSISLQDILVESRKKYTTPRTQVDAEFKKQPTKDDKKGQPPFNDAFKNIFAKRDPAKALEMGAKKPDPTRPKEEGSIQKSEVAVPAAPAPTEPAPLREIPEDELRSLLYVSPRPA